MEELAFAVIAAIIPAIKPSNSVIILLWVHPELFRHFVKNLNSELPSFAAAVTATSTCSGRSSVGRVPYHPSTNSSSKLLEAFAVVASCVADLVACPSCLDFHNDLDS